MSSVQNMPNSGQNVIRATDFLKHRRQQAGGAPQGKPLRSLPSAKASVPEANSFTNIAKDKDKTTTLRHNLLNRVSTYVVKDQRSVEERIREKFDQRRLNECYRCFEVQYLLYLAFRDAVSSFKTANAAASMPWGSTPNRTQLVMLRRTMRKNLSSLAERCFAGARQEFYKTGFAAAAPIYEVHEAANFAGGSLVRAVERCKHLLLDQKELKNKLQDLEKQVSSHIGELEADNAQLENRLNKVLNKN